MSTDLLVRPFAALRPTPGQDLLTRTALGRSGTPADIAGLVVHLSQPAGAWITGQVIAVDGGMIVQPESAKHNIESGVIYGLSSVLHERVTVKDGVVEQSNFHDYQVLRMSEMPKIEVHIVPSAERPTGVGEPGVPPIAPAMLRRPTMSEPT